MIIYRKVVRRRCRSSLASVSHIGDLLNDQRSDDSVDSCARLESVLYFGGRSNNHRNTYQQRVQRVHSHHFHTGWSTLIRSPPHSAWSRPLPVVASSLSGIVSSSSSSSSFITNTTTLRTFHTSNSQRKKSTAPRSDTTTSSTPTTTTTTTTNNSNSNKKRSNSVPSWLQEETPTHVTVLNVVKAAPGQLWNFNVRFLKWIVKCIRDPAHFKETFSEIWHHTKHEFQRYKTGTKLLIADVQLAANIMRRVLQGYSLSRRERKQLKRTAIDILRVGPLAMFVIIPGMELALPFALRMFPNMLPSTFRETLKTQEDKKRLLRARIEMTSFFQSTMREFAEDSKIKARRRQEQMERLALERKENRDENVDETTTDEDREILEYDEDPYDEEAHESINLELNRASRLMDAIDKVREGAVVDTKTIIEMAQLFKDGITLDTVSRSHLVAMCKYMGLNAFGSDPYLRFQLRSAIRDIRNDDQSILWEGPESLSTEELKAACEERGMRASGLTRDEYLSQLQHWLDMSVNKNVPLTLLVMSRAFLFTTSDPSAQDETAALQEAVSQLDEDVIVDAVIEAAESSAAMSATPMDAEEAAKEMEVLSQLKLERLERQRELIEEEREEAAEIEQEKRDAEKEEKEELADSFPEVPDTASILTSSSGGAKTYAEHHISAAGADANAAATTTMKTTKAAKMLMKSTKKRKNEKLVLNVMGEEEKLFGTARGMQLVLSKAEIEALESLATNSAVEAERSLLEKLKLLKREAEVADILATGTLEAQMDQEEQETNATDTGTGGMLLSEKETPVEVEEESLSKKLKESIPTLEDLKESASKIADDMTLESDDEELDEEEDKQKEVEREMKEEMEREADVLRRGRNRLEKMILRLEAELEEADQEIGSSLNLLDQNHDGICTTAELRNAYTKVLKEDDTSKADALIARVDPSSKGYFKIADLHGLLEDLEEDDTDSKIFEFLGGKGVREED